MKPCVIDSRRACASSRGRLSLIQLASMNADPVNPDSFGGDAFTRRAWHDGKRDEADPILGATHTDQWTWVIEGEELVERRGRHFGREGRRDHAQDDRRQHRYVCPPHLLSPGRAIDDGGADATGCRCRRITRTSPAESPLVLSRCWCIRGRESRRRFRQESATIGTTWAKSMGQSAVGP